MRGRAERTFLVESYVPRLDERSAKRLTSSLRETIRQLNEDGMPLRLRASFALVDEETYLCIIAAPKIDHVGELSERVGLEQDHIVEALMLDAPVTPG